MILSHVLCRSLSCHLDCVSFLTHPRLSARAASLSQRHPRVLGYKIKWEKNRATANALHLFLLPSCGVTEAVLCWGLFHNCLAASFLAGEQKASCGSDCADQILLWKDRRCIILANILGEKLTVPLNVHSWWRTNRFWFLHLRLWVFFQPPLLECTLHSVHLSPALMSVLCSAEFVRRDTRRFFSFTLCTFSLPVGWQNDCCRQLHPSSATL